MKFFTDIVLPGLAWDATKGVFASLWKGLEKLSKRTKDFDIRCMEFKFDDITIHVGDVMANNYGSIMRLFLKMHENVQYLHSKGVDGINKISVPFMPSEYEEGPLIMQHHATTMTIVGGRCHTCMDVIKYSLIPILRK